MRVGTLIRMGCLAAAMAILTLRAHASYIISIQQVGSNVVATGSGSIDTTGLTNPVITQRVSLINAAEGQVSVGPVNNTEAIIYSGLTGPASLGADNTNHSASSGSGPGVGVEGSTERLFLRTDYVSGTPIGASTDTFTNQSLATLGLTPGTYTYTWGTGIHADSLSVQVVPTPEPASLSLFAVAGISLLRRSRGRKGAYRGS
jgi:hypothetical protein